ncbi:MAG TPA: DNA topoisomerase I [Gammaproteobacteria bacterium]|nr:DNA topoisomerase I [Gammaproteobacteria bacterium]
MGKNLVIVESPAKARTIEKYLGSDFEVLASYGHVRDLVPKEGAVDPEHGFKMKYQLIDKNEKHVEKIVKAVKKADAVYLATDPDREGEAISWHVYEVLKDRDVLDSKAVHRVVFHEVTKRAIQEAINQPRKLSEELVNAQQARRALDYLVGFNLSPLLWKKVRRGLSAGRVQSPALRLIVEREDEITAFKAQEYWTIEALAEQRAQPGAPASTQFPARLAVFDAEKVEQFTFTNEAQVRAAEQKIRDTARGALTVAKVDKKQRRRNPAAPFTTSTLQQEASRKLGFSAQRTMTVAQRLYEGIDIGEGTVGLITYMRTDSVTLAEEALRELRSVIADRYGNDNLPDEPRRYTTKAKNAQEAHEAIRPTSASRAPEDLRRYLDPNQYKLYELIWKRTVASQMNPAVYDTVALDLVAGESTVGEIAFRATGSVLVSPGFIAVYTEGLDDAVVDEQDHILPAVVEGDRLSLTDVQSAQHFTEPPPRYSEATLVKALEEFGIGRPSTYASIISTLRNREYVEMDNRRFIPTDVGRVVNRFLTQFFSQYVDYEFTARMEDDLDAVSRGEREWVPLLEQFWKPFSKLVEHTEANVTREQASQARILGTDPVSGRPVSVRMGRYGAFVQIGTKEDEDKPKFAGLRPGQKMDTITLDVALDLFKLPRELGLTQEGEPVSANIGRFGPYVRYGSKFVSIRGDDPYTITLERALQLIAEKKIADANKLIRDFPDAGIQVLNGRYGPYVTDKKKNAKIPKDRVPAELTLEECQGLLAAAPERRARGMRRGKAAAPAASAAAAADETSAALPAAAAAKKTKKKTKKAARKPSAARKKSATAEPPSPPETPSPTDGTAGGGETPDA